jgi:ADP-heptose:LPS heptosyltransferase
MPPILQRYNGCDLGNNPHIAVLGSNKVGNFVVTIPLLTALKRRYPDAVIDFWGSELTADFENALPQLAWRCSWDRADSDNFQQLAQFAADRLANAGSIDLLINCDGFNPLTQVLASWLRPTWVAGAALNATCRKPVSWGDHPFQKFLNDPDWDSPAFLERYGSLFPSNYIAELICRLAFLEERVTDIELPFNEPSFDVPDILIHVTTTRAAKLWPLNHWSALLAWCEAQHLSVGLVGSSPAVQQEQYNSTNLETTLLAGGYLIDLRGKTSLIQLAGACKATRAVVSVDAGPLHIAAAMGTPTLAIVGNDADGVGASPIRLWMPRSANATRTVSSHNCAGCAELRFRNDGCVKEGHGCMAMVQPEQVIDWLGQFLSAG